MKGRYDGTAEHFELGPFLSSTGSFVSHKRFVIVAKKRPAFHTSFDWLTSIV